MISRRTAFLILATLAAVAVLQNFYYWLHLPDRVATHFNASGVPDNWSSRNMATLLMLGLQLGFPTLMNALIPMISRLPTSMFNLPHREYWLAPERREHTLGIIAGKMSLIAIAAATFFIGLNHVTFVANQGKGRLPMLPFGILTAVFLLTVLSIAFTILFRFNKIPSEPS